MGFAVLHYLAVFIKNRNVTKTICLGSAMPKGGHFSAKTNKGWDPKAQSLKAYGEGRKEGKPRKRRVRYGFR